MFLLTENGIKEAIFSAEKLIKNNIQISTIYTSFLKELFNTSKIVSNFIEILKKKYSIQLEIE